MDETEYRKTYHDVNPLSCPYEKAILCNRCACSRAHRYYLAEREGVGCVSPAAHQRCEQLLQDMRSKAAFALHTPTVEGRLPHAKALKVQIGGLLGLQAAMSGEPAEQVADIHALIDAAEREYGGLDQLPYPLIMRTVVGFTARKRRR